jgi:hypothetical protein
MISALILLTLFVLIWWFPVWNARLLSAQPLHRFCRLLAHIVCKVKSTTTGLRRT